MRNSERFVYSLDPSCITINVRTYVLKLLRLRRGSKSFHLQHCDIFYTSKVYGYDVEFSNAGGQ
jgi:hypothetical protein